MSVHNIVNHSTQDPGLRWLVLAAGIMMCFFSLMTNLVFAPLMGVIAQDVGVDIGTASFGFMGVMMLVTAIAVLFSGILIDKIGIFQVTIAGLLLLIGAHLLYPLVGHSYNGVIFLRIVTAVGGAPGLVLLEPIVSRWFPPNQRGLALGLNGIAVLGVVAGFTLGPALVAWAGNWQGGLAWISLFLGGGLAYVLYVNYLAKENYVAPIAQESFNHEAVDKESFVKILGSSHAFWLGLAVMALSNWANNSFNDLSPGYLAVAPPTGVGYGAALAGKLASGSMIGLMVGLLVGGVIIDKVCKGRSGILVMAGFVLNLIFYNGILLEPIYGNLAALSGWMLVAGFINPFTAVGNQYFAVRNFSPKVIGKVAAAWTCVSNFIGSFGVMLGSYTIHLTGTYHVAFGILTAACILGFIAALVSREVSIQEGNF